MWIAVDLRNAQYAVGGRPEYGLQYERLPKTFGRSRGGALELLSSLGPYLEAVYVHPNGAAWKISAADGTFDADGAADGTTTVALGAFERIVATATNPSGSNSSLLPAAGATVG